MMLRSNSPAACWAGGRRSTLRSGCRHSAGWRARAPCSRGSGQTPRLPCCVHYELSHRM